MSEIRKKPDAPQPSDKTRAQYETFPYPARDPKDEDKRIVVGSPGNWDEVVHFVFGGRDPSADGKKIKVLVAGGGTGDALVMLAQQARDRKAKVEIVYIDLSESSRKIAEARIKRRNLEKSVKFVTGSFVDLAGKYGPFDYIDCCGVLHHLPDPDAGLKALADALKPRGGMGLMVYGELGRIGVYHMQEMMERLSAEAGGRKRLNLGKALFDSLPGTNWLKRNPFVNDHIQGEIPDFTICFCISRIGPIAWTRFLILSRRPVCGFSNSSNRCAMTRRPIVHATTFWTRPCMCRFASARHWLN